MKANITWGGNIRFDAETESGHTIVMDGAPKNGGNNEGARPMELLLVGMGGCTGIDVVSILKKGRAELDAMEIRLEAERAATTPAVFTRINVHFVLTGKDLKPGLVERAIKLSAEKYCSASIMLGETAEITHSFEIVDSPAA